MGRGEEARYFIHNETYAKKKSGDKLTDTQMVNGRVKKNSSPVCFIHHVNEALFQVQDSCLLES